MKIKVFLRFFTLFVGNIIQTKLLQGKIVYTNLLSLSPSLYPRHENVHMLAFKIKTKYYSLH